MAYWCAARLLLHHEAYALRCLAASGYETYLPRLREQCRSHGRKILVTPPLFPGYAFVLITLQWHAARWAPGTCGLIMDGVQPARVPDHVIEEIRARERGGLVELPKPPSAQPGDRVRVVHGPLAGLAGLYDGMRPRERVLVLLTVLGACRRVELRADDIEVV
jgi:transcription antitermination factor NusG